MSLRKIFLDKNLQKTLPNPFAGEKAGDMAVMITQLISNSVKVLVRKVGSQLSREHNYTSLNDAVCSPTLNTQNAFVC